MKLWQVFETIRDFSPRAKRVTSRDATWRHITFAETAEEAIIKVRSEVSSGDLSQEWEAEPYDHQTVGMGMLRAPRPRKG